MSTFRMMWSLTTSLSKVAAVAAWFTWSMIGSIPLVGTVIQLGITSVLLYQTGILEIIVDWVGLGDQWDNVIIAFEGVKWNPFK